MKLRTLFTESSYAVCYRFSEKDILDDTSTCFKTLLPTETQWYADPFVYVHNGEYYVFMEMMMTQKGYAGLGYSKLVNGELTPPKLIIDYGKHLSFPFIFDYKDEIYIMPESCSESKIKLFKCKDFPDKWEEVYAVEDQRDFYDSVGFCHENKLYLFTSQATSDMYGSKLYLMELDDSSDFPTITAEREITDNYCCSRQAGKMMAKDGKLIRVAQDCSKKEYGRALEFLQIDNMDMENYSEHLLKHIDPKNILTEKHLHGKVGVHTYNRQGTFEVVDMRLAKFSVSSTLKKARIIFNMILKK